MPKRSSSTFGLMTHRRGDTERVCLSAATMSPAPVRHADLLTAQVTTIGPMAPETK